jgi:threonine/homoserine/homoserine lactone efflux protein
MEQISLLTYLTVVAMMVLTPGPNIVVILQSVATRGLRGGFGNLFGVFAGFYFHAFCSVIGLSLIFKQSPMLFNAVKAVGAGYLIYLGISNLRMAWSLWQSKKNNDALPAVVSGSKVQASSRSALLEGFLTNVLNPKVGLFYLAIFPQFIGPNDSIYAKSLLLVTIHAGFAFGWYSILILSFESYRSKVGGRSMVLLARLVIAAVLIGLGARVLLA